MTTIDKSGTSVEDIIAAFRTEYQIRDWELKYDILKKPSNGFFGLFAHKIALVRFQLPTTADRATMFTDHLLKKMGISFDSITAKMEGKTLYLEIMNCKDTGFLIGKNGLMLETLQYLVNRIFEDDRKLEKIYLDADGYRERREAMFIRPFLPQISKIKVHGKPMTLEPMNAAERRIIHRHVERDKGLRTLTIGEGEMKRVVIFSSRQTEKDALSQSRADSGAERPKAPVKREERSPKPERAPKPEAQDIPVQAAEPKPERPPRKYNPRFDRNRRPPRRENTNKPVDE